MEAYKGCSHFDNKICFDVSIFVQIMLLYALKIKLEVELGIH